MEEIKRTPEKLTLRPHLSSTPRTSLDDYSLFPVVEAFQCPGSTVSGAASIKRETQANNYNLLASRNPVEQVRDKITAVPPKTADHNAQRISCRFCDKSYTFERSLKMHVKRNHIKHFSKNSKTGINHIELLDESRINSTLYTDVSKKGAEASRREAQNETVPDSSSSSVRWLVDSMGCPPIENDTYVELPPSKMLATPIQRESLHLGKRPIESGHTQSWLALQPHGSPQKKKIKFKVSDIPVNEPGNKEKVSQAAASLLPAPESAYIDDTDETESLPDPAPALWTRNKPDRETNRRKTLQSQKSFWARIADVPPVRLSQVWRYFAESNPVILETYENRNMDERHVQDKIDLIRESISDYDYYIKGEESNDKTRRRLQLLENVTPLIELGEILEEPDSVFEQRSTLILLLRKMFSVTTGIRLEHKLISLGPQIQHLSLPLVIRGCLGYLVYHEIFLEGTKIETPSIQRAMTKGLTRLFAAKAGPEIDQYIRLLVLEEDDFKIRLEVRARQLAEQFYDILYPLTHWLTESPTNVKQKHINKLVKVTRQSLRLASELDARMGTFTYTWPIFGDPFDPENIAPDECQADDVEAMCFDSIKRKQMVVYTLMCGVRGVMPQDEVVGRYAMATSILGTPYKTSLLT